MTAGLIWRSIVEEDLGREIAMQIASQLVMFFKRPGGQMQFSRKGEAVPAGRSALQELQRWITADPALDHSVAKLAKRGAQPTTFCSAVSQRGWNYARDLGRRVPRQRRSTLTRATGIRSPKQVATHCGFADADTLRCFVRHVRYPRRISQALYASCRA